MDTYYRNSKYYYNCTWYFYKLAFENSPYMKKSLAIVLFISVSSSLVGQKIKYKDLFPILDSKNYAEGGPQLISYLSDPKNAEEANAQLQMGLMLEAQLMSIDPVSEPEKTSSKGDSVISYLNVAKSLITEKEIKKNDEYYQSFFRRDLRTGKFGIKLSDVHLDIEEKIKAIELRLENTKLVDEKLVSTSNNYKTAAVIYKTFADQFLEYNSFLIGADEKIKEELTKLIEASEKAQEEAKDVLKLAETLDSKAFSDEIVLKEIEEFGKDGIIVSEIKSGTIEMWNYADWAVESQSEIRGSIGLFKSLVLNYAYEIREKKDKVKKGNDAVIEMLNAELISQFQKYDPESTVEKLLRIETFEAQIIKGVDISINEALQDSSLIGSQLQIFEKAKVKADEMHVLVNSITQDDLDQAKKLYDEYINSFFSKYGTASKYVSDMKIWSSQQVKWLADAIEFWDEKNMWGQSGENKIPLYIQDAPETNFHTLGMPVKEIEEVIVWGANMETKKGYLIGFGPDRFEKWNLEFELPNSEVIQFVSDTVPSAEGSTSFHVFNEAVQENNLVVVSFTAAGELNWKSITTVPKKPVAYKFDNITQELTIFLYPEEELPLDSDELGYKVIDRTGEVR